MNSTKVGAQQIPVMTISKKSTEIVIYPLHHVHVFHIACIASHSCVLFSLKSMIMMMRKKLMLQILSIEYMIYMHSINACMID